MGDESLPSKGRDRKRVCWFLEAVTELPCPEIGNVPDQCWRSSDILTLIGPSPDKCPTRRLSPEKVVFLERSIHQSQYWQIHHSPPHIPRCLNPSGVPVRVFHAISSGAMTGVSDGFQHWVIGMGNKLQIRGICLWSRNQVPVGTSGSAQPKSGISSSTFGSWEVRRCYDPLQCHSFSVLTSASREWCLPYIPTYWMQACGTLFLSEIAG
ncbi:hypothetical protein BDV30DRAFT_107822 [Aspergillus minisclerotigenes]|uniref:Uncharacterized protein n=1 Tax=Aspergillus minisclerotigenes TaxID=656917 RepID=A0A5N6J4X8_9EURO|nr:hypothetical protein BDV30DRAFT_107822 [Aspergillus minisclerotigenes]